MIISMLTDKLHCWFKAVRAIEITEKCGNGSIGQNRIENLIGEESMDVVALWQKNISSMHGA